MSDFILTRSEIEQKLVELTSVVQDSTVVKEQIHQWMVDKQCSDFEMSQILNDLTSYEVYLKLLS